MREIARVGGNHSAPSGIDGSSSIVKDAFASNNPPFHVPGAYRLSDTSTRGGMLGAIKYSRPSPGNVDPQSLQIAKDAFIQRYEGAGLHNSGFTSPAETVAALRPDSSTGFPWQSLPKEHPLFGGKKGEWMVPGYKSRHLIQYLEYCQKQTDPACIPVQAVVASAKRELLPIKKVRAGKTRNICAPSLYECARELSVSKAFDTKLKAYVRCNNAPIDIGSSPHDGNAMLKHRIHPAGWIVSTSDVKAFDQSHELPIQLAVRDIRAECGPTDETREAFLANLDAVYRTEIQGPIVCPNGQVLLKDHGMISGSNRTTTDNCMRRALGNLYVWIVNVVGRTVTIDGEPHVITVMDYYKYTIVWLQGDDEFMFIHPTVYPYFSLEVRADILAEAFGWVLKFDEPDSSSIIGHSYLGLKYTMHPYVHSNATLGEVGVAACFDGDKLLESALRPSNGNCRDPTQTCTRLAGLADLALYTFSDTHKPLDVYYLLRRAYFEARRHAVGVPTAFPSIGALCDLWHSHEISSHQSVLCPSVPAVGQSGCAPMAAMEEEIPIFVPDQRGSITHVDPPGGRESVAGVIAAEKKLHKELTPLGATKPGMKWVVAATDVFHDVPVDDMLGYPDNEGDPSVVYIVKRSVTVVQPKSLAPGDKWDCNIAITPYLATQQAAEFDISAPSTGFGPPTVKFGSTAPGKTIGSVTVVTAPTNTPTFPNIDPGKNANLADPLIEIKGISPVDVETSTGEVKQDLCDGRVRLIGVAFEVVNTSPQLTCTGVVSVYSQSSRPMNSMVTTNAANEGYMDCDFTRAPPSTLSDAMLLPGTMQWSAKEGCYVNGRLASTTVPADQPNFKYRTIIGGDLLPGAWPKDVPLAPGWMAFPVGTQESFTTQTSHRHEFQTSGAYFSGLSGSNGLAGGDSLQVNVKFIMERFPTPDDASILVSARPCCPFDPIALRAYTEIVRRMPVGCKLKDNSLGSWFKGAVSALGKAIPTIAGVARPLLNNHPKAKMALDIAEGLAGRGGNKKKAQREEGVALEVLERRERRRRKRQRRNARRKAALGV